MKNNLQLQRPVVFFDIESTGTDTNIDRIVEIAFLKLYPGNRKDLQTFRINPGIAIPPETTEIHGITDDDVKDKPSFSELKDLFLEILDNADLGGYNLIRFDIPMLQAELRRAGTDLDMTNRRIIDPHIIFAKHERRDLSSAYRFYCGKDLENAHSAEADITATAEILMEQIERYEDINSSVESLHEYCMQKDPRFVDRDRRFKWKNNEPCCNFGKNKGQMLRWLAQNDQSYLHWILRGDFNDEVKELCRNALDGKIPTKKQ